MGGGGGGLGGMDLSKLKNLGGGLGQPPGQLPGLGGLGGLPSLGPKKK